MMEINAALIEAARLNMKTADEWLLKRVNYLI